MQVLLLLHRGINHSGTSHSIRTKHSAVNNPKPSYHKTWDQNGKISEKCNENLLNT